MERYLVLMAATGVLALAAAGAAAAPGEVLWSEDFSEFTVGAFEGQDPCWSFEDEGQGANFTAWISDYPGFQLLGMSAQNDAEAGWIYYWGRRDLTSDLVEAPEQVAFEFYLVPLFRANQWLVTDAWVGLDDHEGNPIVWIYVYSAGTSSIYHFVGQELGAPHWSGHGFNHYRIEIDFDDNTARLFVGLAMEPRMTVALPDDFSAADIATLRVRIGTGAANRTSTAYVHDFKIIDNTELVCPEADATGDCVVDMADFALLANYWQMVGVLSPDDPNLVN